MKINDDNTWNDGNDNGSDYRQPNDSNEKIIIIMKRMQTIQACASACLYLHHVSGSEYNDDNYEQRDRHYNNDESIEPSVISPSQSPVQLMLPNWINERYYDCDRTEMNTRDWFECRRGYDCSPSPLH